MDKGWIDKYGSDAYINGVEKFLDFAYANNGTNKRIYCPCKSCCNRYLRPRDEVEGHIFAKGFLRKYRRWTYHGETYGTSKRVEDKKDGNRLVHNDTVAAVHEARENSNIVANGETTNATLDVEDKEDRDGLAHKNTNAIVQEATGISNIDANAESTYATSNRVEDNEGRNGLVRNDIFPLVHEAMGTSNIDADVGTRSLSESRREVRPNKRARTLLELLKDVEQPLYPGCEKFTQLSFVVQMLKLKVTSGWADESFTMLLELLEEAFPEGTQLPNSYYKANKMTTDLGFNFEKWDIAGRREQEEVKAANAALREELAATRAHQASMQAQLDKIFAWLEKVGIPITE
ncbi:hypothetical protein Syun_018428 [Stephania yunnanensis]|uniref:Transposase-associated domain-containing protein n=1 Tax=Stephania yunnanensis TaxID=152371 RepID=A0AAP0IUI7_9MAGN